MAERCCADARAPAIVFVMDLAAILTDERARAMRAAGYWRDETLLDLFEARVAETPNKDAIVEQPVGAAAPRRLTFADLDRAADALAAQLLEAGVERQTVVSWQLPNGALFLALHLACPRVGAISNPLMPIFRERELRFMLGLAESRVVVVPATFRGFDHAGMLRGLRPELPAVRRLLVVGGEPADAPELARAVAPETRRAWQCLRATADEVTQVMYTSGTTGEPKGVMHTANTLLSHVRPAVARLELQPDDVVLCSTPMSHQLGFLYGVIAPLMLGTTVVCQDVWNAEWAAKLSAQETRRSSAIDAAVPRPARARGPSAGSAIGHARRPRTTNGSATTRSRSRAASAARHSAQARAFTMTCS